MKGRSAAARFVFTLLLIAACSAPVSTATLQTTAGVEALLVKRRVEKGAGFQSSRDESDLFKVSNPKFTLDGNQSDQEWTRVQNDASRKLTASRSGAPLPLDEARREAWELAFSYLAENHARVVSGDVIDVEPDVECPVTDVGSTDFVAPVNAKASPTEYGVGKDPMPFWPTFKGHDGFLSTDYSQLLDAYQRVAAQTPAPEPATIAILDIGFVAHHTAFPAAAILPIHDMADPNRPPQHGKPGEPYYPPPKAPNGPEHGTATSALLAAPVRKVTGAPIDVFSGGNPDAKVLPIRIGHSVVVAPLPIYFSKAGDVARGFTVAADSGAEILSMSVGGTASRALADAVDHAYESGVAMFCATGDFIEYKNNNELRTPWYVVYPAAFENVMGVCGVTAARKPYGQPDSDAWKQTQDKLMLGSFGPKDKMHNVVAGWGPNVPWVEFPAGIHPPMDPWNVVGDWNRLGLDGGGTSANTPQVAAAASLVLEHHRSELSKLNGWKRVESIYQVLRDSAEKPKQANAELFFGNGFLRASRAVDSPLPPTNQLKHHSAKVGFYWLKVLASAFLPPPVLQSDDEAVLRPALGVALDRLLPRLSSGGEDREHRYGSAIASAVETEIAQVVSDSSSLQAWLDETAAIELVEKKRQVLAHLLGEKLSPTTREVLAALQR